MTADDAEQAVFGASDGLVSALGLVLALAVTGHSQSALLGGIALACAAGVSMGAGEWLSDDSRSIRRAVVMGVASLLGSVIPVIPLAVGVSPWWCLASTGLGVCVVSYLRPEKHALSLARTLGVLVPATVIAVGATLLASS